MVVALVLVGVLALWLLVVVCRASMEYAAFMNAVRSMKRMAREAPSDRFGPLLIADFENKFVCSTRLHETRHHDAA